MIFDTSIHFEKENAAERLKWLSERSKVIELKEVRPRRSISQNSYLHLVLTWFAINYGERMDYVKQVFFKQVVNPEIFRTEFVNQKTGEIREDWKSTAELDTKEMTTAIDRFRSWSAKEAGIFLPEPSDMVAINHIEKEIKKQETQTF